VLKNFAGININSDSKGGLDEDDALNMSLKQYLIAQDKNNFKNNFG